MRDLGGGGGVRSTIPRLAASALCAVALQSIALVFSPTLYALAAPVHALCLVLIVIFVHPSLPTVLQRAAELQQYQHVSAFELIMTDPVIAEAMQLKSPGAAWQRTLAALGLCAVSDFSEGMHVATGAELWQVAHEGFAAACACAFLYAALPAGVSPSSLAKRATEAAFGCGGMLLCLAAPPPRPGNMGTLLSGLVALRILSACGLAAVNMCSLFGAVGRARPADGSPPKPADHDTRRWVAQAAGSLLTLAAPALGVALAPHPAGWLAIGAQRLGCAALAFACWLSAFPPLPDGYTDGSGGVRAAGAGGGEGAGGYESLEQMRASRRAAREAAMKRRAEAAIPLLSDARDASGGVQGLKCHDVALSRDDDGDEAHDFWEATDSGTFVRVSSAPGGGAANGAA